METKLITSVNSGVGAGFELGLPQRIEVRADGKVSRNELSGLYNKGCKSNLLQLFVGCKYLLLRSIM